MRSLSGNAGRVPPASTTVETIEQLYNIDMRATQLIDMVLEAQALATTCLSVWVVCGLFLRYSAYFRS